MTIKALKNSAPEADQTQSELGDVVQESTALPPSVKTVGAGWIQAAQTISALGSTDYGWVSLEMPTTD